MCLYHVLFCIQQPQNRGGGVFKCLSEAQKLNFLTKKPAFLAFFFIDKWQILVHTDSVNGVYVICVPLQPVFLGSSNLQIGRGSSTACLKPKISIFDKKRPFLADFS